MGYPFSDWMGMGGLWATVEAFTNDGLEFVEGKNYEESAAAVKKENIPFQS